MDTLRYNSTNKSLTRRWFNATIQNVDSDFPFLTQLSVVHRHISTINIYTMKFVLPAILGIGSFWNFLIIIYFVKIHFKRLTKRTSYHFLIINLAVTDLLTTAGSSIYYHYAFKPSWKLGKFGCIIFANFMGHVCPAVSSWILVLITYSRYRRIVYPFGARISKRKIAVVCFCIWALAFPLNIYPFINTQLVALNDGRLVCKDDGVSLTRLINNAVSYSLQSFVPSAIMSFLYVKMRKKMQQGNTLNENPQVQQRNRAVLKTILGLVVLYASTILPVRVISLILRSLVYYGIDDQYLNLMLTIYMLGLYPIMTLNYFMNNILNIFIYAKMMPDFRKFVIRVHTFRLPDGRSVL